MIGMSVTARGEAKACREGMGTAPSHLRAGTRLAMRTLRRDSGKIDPVEACLAGGFARE